MLAAHADVNAENEAGFTALDIAMSWKQPEIAQLLLAANADVNIASRD